MRFPWPASAKTVTPSGEIFTRIYEGNEWLFGSGEGSLPASTEAYRPFLQDFLRDRRISSVVDVGCGDWQSSRLLDWSGIEYLGIDVVPTVIRANERAYARPGIRFECRDVLQDPPPPADLLILKDVLQHWTYGAVFGCLPWLERYRFALITNDVPAGPNADTVLGGYHPYDLRLPPFHVPLTEALRYSGVSVVDGKPWTKQTLLYVNPSAQSTLS